jgi:hypothetical protein
MLSNVRATAGITEVGGKYTTNNSEAVNHIIKIEVEWKESKLPVLINHLQTIAKENQELVQKAVILNEEWKFTREYQSLQVDEHTWFSKMTLESRQKHIQKVQSTKYKAGSSQSTSQSLANDLPSRITVSFNVLKDCDISLVTLERIWHKASQLIESDHVICVTWSDCSNDRLVKSSSSDTPHLAVLRKGLYMCDSRCQMYAGFSICSHVVAAAQHNGELSSYLANFTSSFKSPNLTAIATQGLPAGAGRKGGQTKRKPSKTNIPVESVSSRIVLNSDTSIGQQPNHTSIGQQPSHSSIGQQPSHSSIGQQPSHSSIGQ